MNEKMSRAKIDWASGIVELEGSEAFVSKYLDEFRLETSRFAQGVNVIKTPDEMQPHGPATVSVPKNSTSTEKKKSTTAGAKQVKAESFEVKPTDKLSLEAYFKSKGAPSPHSKRIAILGYYITEILGNQYFTEGNIEFAYKVLKLNRPKYVRQACTDAKNQQQYLEVFERTEGESSAWSLSRLGQIYVEDEAGATT